jgi:hypothetical protein
VLLAHILWFSLRAAAHTPADGDIYAMPGAFTYLTHPVNHNWKSPLVLGPALIAEADLNKHGGLEIAMFYLNNPFTNKIDGNVLTERLKRIYISTGYRHWFNPRVSGAVGFASSYAMGNPVILRDDFANQKNPGTSAHDITEYGIDLSLQYEFWSGGRFHAVVDGRYGLSLTPKTGEDSNHFGVLVGMKYFVQSRQSSVKNQSDD